MTRRALVACMRLAMRDCVYVYVYVCMCECSGVTVDVRVRLFAAPAGVSWSFVHGRSPVDCSGGRELVVAEVRSCWVTAVAR